MNPICHIIIKDEKIQLIEILNRSQIDKDIASYIEENYVEFSEDEQIILTEFNDNFDGQCKAELIITTN